jgi:hypothetical protein
MENASKAIVKLSNECVGAGVEPLAIANEIGISLREFMAQHCQPEACAALLREHLALVDQPDRSTRTTAERELLELGENADQFIRTLILAGIDKRTAITALNNACTLAVAEDFGAIVAADWLRRLADATEQNAPAIDQVARSRSGKAA